MAENNSSAPLKTAEGAYPALPAPDTHCHDEDTGRDVWSHSAEQMRFYAAQAVAAQAAPAAVAVSDLQCKLLGAANYIDVLGGNSKSYRAALAATPALPATEDSSAGDLAEPQFGDAMTREGRMTVLQRNTDGTPTVWCDPEIADIVRALNSGGVKTVASCSGHGEKPGGIALADGRQLLLLESLEAFTSALDAISGEAEVQAEPVARVHLVNTGEVRNGLELYERHNEPVPLAEYETLYKAPQAQPADALDAIQNPQEMADWLIAMRSRLGSCREASQAWSEEIGLKSWDNYTTLSAAFAAMAAAQEGGNASAGKDGAA